MGVNLHCYQIYEPKWQEKRLLALTLEFASAEVKSPFSTKSMSIPISHEKRCFLLKQTFSPNQICGIFLNQTKTCRDKLQQHHRKEKRAIKKVLKKTAIPILFIGMAVISFLKNDYDTFNCMAGLYLIFCHVENVKEEIISEIKKNG